MPLATITSTAQSAVDLFGEFKEVYEFITNTMDSLEQSNLLGKDKLTSVLAVVRDAFDFLNNHWTEWHIKLTKFIQSAKSLYNIVTGRGF